MKKAGSTPESQLADIIIGQVISVSPLMIKVNALELTSTFLMLSPFCKEMIAGGITLWEDLKLNEIVMMLRVSNGQKYYVLQRVEGI